MKIALLQMNSVADVAANIKQMNDLAERAVAQRLTDLVERYSLARWSFTDRVVIAQGATPHSHPVLTLGTDYPHDGALL